MAKANKPTSVEFQEFLRSLHATGYEMGGGFNLDAILRLDGEEREKAEDLLIEALQKGDTRTASVLARFETKKASDALKDVYRKSKAPSSYHSELALALFRATGESNFQEALIEDFGIADKSLRLAAVIHVREAGYSEKAINPLLTLALVDEDEDIRYAAAVTILKFAGIEEPVEEIEIKKPVPARIKRLLPFEEPFNGILKNILDKDSTRRNQAVLNLRKLFQNLPDQ